MSIKKVITTMLLGVVLATMGIPFAQINVFAAASDHTNTITAKEEVSTFAIKTVWKYRTKNGKTQKRLWSSKESKWLTDWEYV